jgi:large subunit ribosomal protein L21
MFAVIKAGGKQHRVVAEQVLKVHGVTAKEGEVVTFPVMAHGGDKPALGAPLVEGATVAGEVLGFEKSRTVIAFKKRRRQNSKRKRGYRDQYALIRITEILTGGKEPSKTPPARAERPKKPRVEVTDADADGSDDAPKKPAKQAKSKAKAPAKKPKGAAKKPKDKKQD